MSSSHAATTATKSATAAPKPSATASKSASASASATTSRKTSSSRAPSGTSSPTASPTPTAPAPTGLGAGAIGGIAAAIVFAIAGVVALIFYKRRKRDLEKDDFKPSPRKSSDAFRNPNNYDPSYKPPTAAISGPLALGGGLPSDRMTDNDDYHNVNLNGPNNSNNNNNEPTRSGSNNNASMRAESRFREQQSFHPGQRDELLGVGKGGLSPPPVRNNSNKNMLIPPKPATPSPDYYDDNLVNNYSDDKPAGNTSKSLAGAAAPIAMVNLAPPQPEYYLGKEDIDPRRDLRGLDKPPVIANGNNNNNVRNNNNHNNYPGGVRPSLDSDTGSGAYQSLEEAQNAHFQKMRGHKESIGSVDQLPTMSDASRSPVSSGNGNSPNGRGGNNNGNNNNNNNNNNKYANTSSVALSESTVSLMPELPPIQSPPLPTHLNSNQHNMSMNMNSGPINAPRGHPNQLQQQQQHDPRAMSPAPPRQNGGISPYADSVFSDNEYQQDAFYQGGSGGGSPQYPNGGGGGGGYNNGGYGGQGYGSPGGQWNNNQGGYNQQQQRRPPGPGGYGGYQSSPMMRPQPGPGGGTRPQQPPRNNTSPNFGGNGGYANGPPPYQGGGGYNQSPYMEPQRGHHQGPPRQQQHKPPPARPW